MQELISKAEVLPQELPDLQRFRSATFVIKYGGSFMDSPEAAGRAGVVKDVVHLVSAGIGPVLVHGGGKAITAALARAGLATEFLQGMRVTDEAAVQVVERVLSREINPEIVSTINGLGGKAKGFSGTEIFTCRKLWLLGAGGERLDPGFVGEVVAVNQQPLRECVKNAIIPVVSPTARGQDGRIYNCNADVAAAEVAIALQAERLVFMSDVPGVLRDAKNPNTLIPRLCAGEAEDLKKSGVIDKGMIPKVDSAVAALRAGVKRVFFVDGRVVHAVLLEMFTKEPMGTEIVL
jgi:acetylglutamate kinase